MKLTIRTASLQRLEKELLDMLSNRSASTQRRVFKAWHTLYRNFLQDRFAKFSRGRGNWPPHSQRTIDQYGPHPLLRLTGELYKALAGSYGVIPGGIRVMMPRRKHNSGLSLNRIAEIHHFGLGVVPKREIWALPTETTKKRMRAVMRDWLNDAINRSKRT